MEIERLKCVELGVKLGSLETNACAPGLSSHRVGIGPTRPTTHLKMNPGLAAVGFVLPSSQME